MGKKALALAMVIAVVIMVVILNTTVPTAAGPVGVLAIFILTYIIILGFITFLLYGLSRLVAKVSLPFTAKRPLERLSFRKSYYFASIAALGPVMLIGMQSVSGIGVYEFFLVCFFVVIGCIYVGRRMA